MNLLAAIVLIGWIPVVLPLFAVLPTRRAVILAYILAWLFLPNVGFNLPGLPDFTKVTATSIGILLGALLFDPGPLFALRPSWRDIPMLALCVCPFVVSMTNDLGAYDGASALVGQTITWGIPYLIARAYLSDPEGIRDLAIGIVVGGLIYVPLCHWEMRMSPHLQATFYGGGTRAFNSVRFGGYRPRVFMNDGLELGMWMAASALIACWLWASGAVREIAGWRFGPPVVVLVVTAVLCKSTGAVMEMVLGMAVLWASRRFRSALPALVLAALAPLYCGVRTLGLWDGRSAVELIRTTLSEERAGSLEFRLINEDMLIKKSMVRPVFGWGGWSRSRVFDETGKDVSVTDGLWIIALGTQGIVGLCSHVAILTLPLLLLVGRYPARRWRDPDVAPNAVLAVLLSLYMIDNISNAMFNPIYYLAAGALLGSRPLDRDAVDPEVAGPGGPGEDFESAWRHAEDLEAEALARDGDWAGVARAWGKVVADAGDRGGLTRHELAAAQGRLGLALARLGRWGDAIEARERALDLLAESSARDAGGVAASPALAAEMDALARLLCSADGPAYRDPARAVSLASRAVRIAPGVAPYYNTLGAALLRAGDWSEALAAVGRSIVLGRRGGTRDDHLFQAIAYAHLGDRDAARTSLRAADSGLTASGSEPFALEDLRAETLRLLADEADVPAQIDRTSPPPPGGSPLP